MKIDLSACGDCRDRISVSAFTAAMSGGPERPGATRSAYVVVSTWFKQGLNPSPPKPDGQGTLVTALRCCSIAAWGIGMVGRVAIVGTGPTGIYTFMNLLQTQASSAISLFEKGEKVGFGMPYSPETASKSMLANIASIEIPPLVTPYLDWLDDQPSDRLRFYGLERDDLDDRKFTPRLLLGEYFRDQLLSLIERARESGIEVAIHERTEVKDVETCGGALFLTTSRGTHEGPFDRVVLSTGHDFADEDEATRSYFPSPWSGLIQARIPAVRVGIMGTSLSSIDAAMAVAGQHGRFRRRGDELSFETDTKDLHVTMMSWTGVLPEADFYCPIPYVPPAVITPAAVAECGRQARPLDALFELIRAEITEADPAYAGRIGLAGLTADTFADSYFAAREAQDPFRWARINLEEAERNKAEKITVPWRYALLRMHEKRRRDRAQSVRGRSGSVRQGIEEGLCRQLCRGSIGIDPPPAGPPGCRADVGAGLGRRLRPVPRGGSHGHRSRRKNTCLRRVHRRTGPESVDQRRPAVSDFAGSAAGRRARYPRSRRRSRPDRRGWLCRTGVVGRTPLSDARPPLRAGHYLLRRTRRSDCQRHFCRRKQAFRGQAC